MSSKRKAVSSKIKFDLNVEAGYRCAIPACRFPAANEIAHIIPYSQTQDNSFSNLILLCSNCHNLYDKEGKIPRSAIEHYKKNLLLLNSRYTDLEKRVLEFFIKNFDKEKLTVHASLEIVYIRLEEDGLVFINRDSVNAISINGFSSGIAVLALTDQGKNFVKNLREGKSIL